MRRRTVLQSVATVGAGIGIGTARGHPTPTDDGTAAAGTDGPATQTASDPLGTIDLDHAYEAVVGSDGTTAYVATGDGFVAVDVSDPAAPALLATRTDLLADHEDGPIRRIQDLAVTGDRLLVAGPAHRSVGAHGFVVFDVTEPSDPVQTAAFAVESTIHNCHFDGRYAYLTANSRDGNPLLVVDAETEREVGEWSLLDVDERWDDVSGALWPLHDVWVQGDRAYLAYWDAGTWILDVSDPDAPALLSTVRGRGPDALAAVEEPRREARLPPGNDHFVTVDETATLLGVGSETFADADGVERPSGIELFDISDPTSPRSLATIDPPPKPETEQRTLTTAHNFELVDGRCYSSWYHGGVRVHDVSDPADPREVYAWRDASAASFWTAQRGADCFVASSTDAIGEVDIQPGLYTFPDPEIATPTPSPTPADALGDQSTAPTTAPDDTALGAGGDGFGVGAALTAVGLWAWRRRSRSG